VFRGLDQAKEKKEAEKEFCSEEESEKPQLAR